MDVLVWLLDSDPAIRWQVLRDLTGASAGEISAERSRVAHEGWGAQLLDLQGPDGQWAGGAYWPAGEDPGADPDPDRNAEVDPHAHLDLPADTGAGAAGAAGAAGDVRADPDSNSEPESFDPGPPPEPGTWENRPQPWTATAHTLSLLRDLGIDPHVPRVRAAVDAVAAHSRWEHAGQRFFDGEVEECINGRALAAGAYFGRDVRGIVDRLVTDQLVDGGWNCWSQWGIRVSSFHSTINVLEGLLEYERSTGADPARVAAAREARERGEEYLLVRHLFRRLSTGEVANTEWLKSSFPPRWHYDVLRALEHFRAVGGTPDPRLAEALDVVRSAQQPDGRWLLANSRPGAVWFTMEDGDGQPSRWNTLRAQRVLAWADA